MEDINRDRIQDVLFLYKNTNGSNNFNQSCADEGNFVSKKGREIPFFRRWTTRSYSAWGKQLEFLETVITHFLVRLERDKGAGSGRSTYPALAIDPHGVNTRAPMGLGVRVQGEKE